MRGSSSEERLQRLKEKVSELPQSPGVYLMKSKVGKIIYVGKAKSLRSRVRSYFGESQDLSPKTRLLVTQIEDFDVLLTKEEVEAFLLEASLIKKHRPKYNIRLKDDKSYPYIKFSWSDEYPRLYLSRKVKRDGGLYFGPYTSGGAVAETIRFLNRTFKVRDCTDAMFKIRKRPCMTHQIGRCKAPCVGLVGVAEYREDMQGVRTFLRGHDTKVLKEITQKMKLAAEQERFEQAAKLRDSLSAIKAILEKQSVINASSDNDQDAIGTYGGPEGTLIQTLHVRQGRVIGTRSHFFPLLDPEDRTEDPREWLVSFLNQYYDENVIPDEILLSTEIGNDLTKLLEAVLRERKGAGSHVTVRFATDEKGRALTEMAHQNAQASFRHYVTKSKEKEDGLSEIQSKLGLAKLPRRIECYDISNFQGAETVASQVVFEDGVPSKDSYRRYRIRETVGIDDYQSMREVLSRRLAHTEYEEPDLIVVDGGKGQLNVAVRVLQELGKPDWKVVGLAKARAQGEFTDAEVSSSDERVFIPGRANPVSLRPSSEAYRILVGIRDEAHRFAIVYHRKLREAASLASRLDSIKGLGPVRKRNLLRAFGSVEEIRQATMDEISKVEGFSIQLAQSLLDQLKNPEGA